MNGLVVIAVIVWLYRVRRAGVIPVGAKVGDRQAEVGAFATVRKLDSSLLSAARACVGVVSAA